MKMQLYEDAAQDFSLLIKVDPSSFESYYNRGIFLTNPSLTFEIRDGILEAWIA